MKVRHLLVLAAAISVAWTSFVHATVIVLVHTPDGYWIGADGVRSEYRTGSSIGTACKVHESHGWLLMKSGASESIDRYGKAYSIDRKVKALFEADNQSDEFTAAISKEYLEEEREAIRYYVGIASPPTLEESDSLRHKFENPINPDFETEQQRNLTLLGYKGGQWVNLSLIARPGAEATTGDTSFPYHFYVQISDWSPTPFNFGHLAFLSYPIASLPVPTHPDSWIVAHPQEAIQEILARAHKDDPSGVGKPYSIIHVRAAPGDTNKAQSETPRSRLKIDWVKRGACPGWNTDISPDTPNSHP